MTFSDEWLSQQQQGDTYAIRELKFILFIS